MKIYFKNRAAKLQCSSEEYSCIRCPFYVCTPCPFYTPTVINCYGKGWWIDGESLDIFRV